MEEIGKVWTMPLPKLREMCGAQDMRKWGIIEIEQKLFFESHVAGSKLHVSLAAILGVIDFDPECGDLEDSEIFFLFWVVTVSPIKVGWDVTTKEGLAEMLKIQKESGEPPPRIN